MLQFITCTCYVKRILKPWLVNEPTNALNYVFSTSVYPWPVSNDRYYPWFQQQKLVRLDVNVISTKAQASVSHMEILNQFIPESFYLFIKDRLNVDLDWNKNVNKHFIHSHSTIMIQIVSWFECESKPIKFIIIDFLFSLIDQYSETHY